MRSVFVLLSLLFALGATPPVARAAADDAQDAFGERARELARLRSDIEQVEADLMLERESQRNRLRALAAQAEELEILVQKERVRIASLGELRDARRAERAAQLARVADLVPPLEGALALLEGHVNGGLPFHREERLAELVEVRRGLREQRLDPETAVSRLWQFVEDELRLCTESGLDRQVVEIDGERRLLDVARLGMTALFFRGDDGRVGRAEARRDDYAWVVLDGEEEREAVRALFEAFRKQIRQGLFRLPVVLGEEVAS